ncbi:MAG: DUF1501 domain-containing protein [Planctomycetaceae bacterium]|nr:DUF1501 domain-containing protein [Planctomycetaceae bacterium]
MDTFASARSDRESPQPLNFHRRSFLGRSSIGVGTLALSSLLHHTSQAQDASESAQWTGVVNPLHFPAKAKRVIFLVMAGGPSHLETLDYKPKLAEMDGQPMPESFTQGQPIAQLQGRQLTCMAPQHQFEKYGDSGQQLANVFPHIGSVADELCVIRSLKTEQINHDPAHTFLNTGTQISGRPSMGAWIQYGLGSESDNLPGFVVLTSVGGGQNQPIAARQWHSGFLPSRFQGVQFHSKGDPVLYVGNPKGVPRDAQGNVVSAINQLNQLHRETVDDPEIATRIAQYEMAFRMQTSVPELMDLSGEPKNVLDLYGTPGADGSFASNCLLARRLAERGVRFIQLYHRGWDHHGNVKGGVETTARLVDQGTAALIQDLKNRDMLKDTLVVWTGEFGRTPMAQGTGRDHHIKGFSMFMCGGGIKPGTSYGATDELGYNAVENVFHVHDLHATMLHLLGIDHEKMTYRFQGRDFRLTDVSGHVVEEILA